MITYVNKTNTEKYSILYEDAVEALKTHDINGRPSQIKDPETGAMKPNPEFTEPIVSDEDFSITSLDEYFGYIVELTTINPIFTKLPLDEDVFEINANTRTITVPKTFQENGISIQGDEIAEIVYFKIDRFFDATDLNTKDIFIQWKGPVDRQGRATEGVSVPWVKDIESEPGFLIFGWALSSDITKTPGTIQFSVRFYEHDTTMVGKHITYSLSTLTASATVKPGLNYDILKVLEHDPESPYLYCDPKDVIIHRLENTTDQATEAKEPIFLVGYMPPTDQDDEGNPIPANVVLDETDAGVLPEGNLKKLVLQAYSEDAGSIGYAFSAGKLTEDQEESADVIRQSVKAEIIYQEVNDESRVEHKVYYTKENAGSAPVYKIYSGEIPAPEGTTLYERVYKFILTMVGKYIVYAQNRVGGSLKSGTPYELEVRFPVEAVIDTQPIERVILDDLEGEKTMSVVASVTDQGTLHYQWLKKELGGAEFTAVEPGQDSPSMEAAEEGFFKVKVINHINNKDSEGVESNEVRVTNKAKPATVTTTAELMKTNIEITKGLVLTVTATPVEPHREEEDSISYQWYRYVPSNVDEIDSDITESMISGYLPEEDDELIAGATAKEFNEYTAGSIYFCVVTNTYNNSEAQSGSQLFRLVDLVENN